MSRADFKVGNFDFHFTDEDVVNPDDVCWEGTYNPHNVRAFFLHEQGFCIAVVFADCLQDALDIAVDAGKLDKFLITPEDFATGDYGTREEPVAGLAYLGNACELFDIESVDYIELKPVKFSYAAIFNAEVTK